MEKFIVDKAICIGCGACTAVAPNTFMFGDDGLAEAKEEKDDSHELTEEEKNDAMSALEGCPVNAIRVEEKND